MSQTKRKTSAILLAAGVLLVVMMSRAPYLNRLELDAHEVWTMWQSRGDVADVILRTPYDWGPLYYVVMNGWQGLVGEHDVLARWLSLLWLMMGCAFLYRAMGRLEARAGLLAMGVYAASAGVLYLSLNIRGYALQLALMPLAMWLVLRLYGREGWSLRRDSAVAVGLAVTMAAMVYIHPTGLLACLLLGIYTVWAHPKRIWLWMLPGVLVVLLTLPQLQARLGTAANRFEGTPAAVSWDSVGAFFSYYIGQTVVQQAGWLGLVVIAVARVMRERRRGLALLLTVISGLGLVVVLGGRLGFGGERHAWWLMTGVALLVGWGAARLPKRVYGGVLVVVLAGLFIPSLPGELDESGNPNPPLGEQFAWLATRARWGDVVVIDAQQQCTPFADEWDYYTRLYFPQGLRVVDAAGDAARVWYISASGWEDPTFKETISRGRIASVFSGPWNCLARLYSGPPDAVGVPYANGMRFHGYEVIEDGQPLGSPLVLREGQAFTVRLWWSSDRVLAGDYSIGLHVMDAAGGMVAQSDSGPQLVQLDPTRSEALPERTSLWSSEGYYVEERTLRLPEALPWNRDGAHGFVLGLVVYQSWDGVRIGAADVGPEGVRLLRTIAARAW
ncbi:MAG: glycosyltransferase family 39 protein [Anaerolineae bacterium]|nr:glycosyltransferase family 39 protein [Anaerolineae bacterium]